MALALRAIKDMPDWDTRTVASLPLTAMREYVALQTARGGGALQVLSRVNGFARLTHGAEQQAWLYLRGGSLHNLLPIVRRMITTVTSITAMLAAFLGTAPDVEGEYCVQECLCYAKDMMIVLALLLERASNSTLYWLLVSVRHEMAIELATALTAFAGTLPQRTRRALILTHQSGRTLRDCEERRVARVLADFCYCILERMRPLPQQVYRQYDKAQVRRAGTWLKNAAGRAVAIQFPGYPGSPAISADNLPDGFHVRAGERTLYGTRADDTDVARFLRSISV